MSPTFTASDLQLIWKVLIDRKAHHDCEADTIRRRKAPHWQKRAASQDAKADAVLKVLSKIK